MKKFIKLLFLLTLLLGAISANAETKRALLVGISDYGNEREDPNKWKNIHGANDIPLLTPLLKEQGFKVTSLVNSQATYNKIKKVIEKLIKNCQKGDMVYLHFSMHGQPFEDLNGDEADGWDEALIPVDAQMQYKKGVYDGSNHLIDDELEGYFDRIRSRIGPTGQLVVVLDACHSGGGVRGDDEHIRGTREGFTRSGKEYKPDRTKENNDYFKVPTKAGQAPIICIEACRSYQVNYEFYDKNTATVYGSLSFYISESMKDGHDVGTGEWIKAIKDGMKNSTSRNVKRQNVVIESSK